MSPFVVSLRAPSDVGNVVTWAPIVASSVARHRHASALDGGTKAPPKKHDAIHTRVLDPTAPFKVA